MSGMAGEFMSSCDSKFFRDRIVAQIAGAKNCHFTDPNSNDPMVRFMARNSPEQLEEFIFNNSKGNREEYLSLTAEMLLALRQLPGGAGRERVNGEDSQMPNGDTANGEHAPSAQASSD